MAAAAVVFFAYIGFDAVSTTAEEAKNPQRDLPIGIIASLVICTILYLVVAAVLSGIVPVTVPVGRFAAGLRRQHRRGHQVPQRAGRLRAGGHQPGLGGRPGLGRRRGRHHQRAARHAHEPAAHLLCDEPRPAAAGRAPARCTRSSRRPTSRRSSPAWSSSLCAALVPIQILGEMTSIGTLFAFMIVCAAVMMLRVQRPEAKRPFKVPGRLRDPGAGHRLVPVSDAQPAGGDLDPLPGMAEPRHADLLGLRPRPQPAARCRRGRQAHGARKRRQLRHRRRRAAAVQRLLHDRSSAS